MMFAPPKRLLALSPIALLTACAAPVKDTTPTNPTVVVKAKYSMEGLFLPDGKGQANTYTRSDRRHLHRDFESDSFLSSFTNSDISNIYRLDRNLLWELNHSSETYRECAISGCTTFAFPEQQEEEEELQSYEEIDCNVALKKNEFKVESTGQQRVISGMKANEYAVTWHIIQEDKNKQQDQTLFKINVWTTAPNSEINQAWAVHEEATDRYLNAVGENNPLVRLLGRDGYKAISAFTGDIEQSEQKSSNAILAKLQNIKGYPLSSKMEIFAQFKACKEERRQASRTQLDFSNGLDGLTDSATSLLGDLVNEKVEDQVQEWQKDALVRHIYEVTSVSEEGVRDSKFEVPANYRLSDRQ
ncbi:hypothetical protein [Vibrio fluminensis]|uniref:hypothetical protein n=1 Tax=Vibrio fluminensis TaxID=2783614 RepID=UPI00188829D1|nr:hypothetical protein [Vibrio fluminensis]